jgi:hypothetical protein
MRNRLDDGPSRPLVSVVIPLYNQGRFLADCIRSLQVQTYPHWEALIVNDGSTDDSLRIANELAHSDGRIQVLSKANGGLSSARNHGLDRIRGRFVQFLDADDVLLPRKFEIQVEALGRMPERAVSVSKFLIAGNGRLEAATPAPLVLEPGFSLDEFIDRWEFRLSIPCHSFLFCASHFRAGGVRFDPRLPNHEDFECWVRLFATAPEVSIVPEWLAIYRHHVGGMTRNHEPMRKGFLAAIDLLLLRPELSESAQRHLQGKKAEINRVYDRKMGLDAPPFPLRYMPGLRVFLGGVRNKVERVFSRRRLS